MCPGIVTGSSHSEKDRPELERLAVVRAQAREVAAQIGGVGDAFPPDSSDAQTFEVNENGELCKLCGVDFVSSVDAFPTTSRCFEMLVHSWMICTLILICISPVPLVAFASTEVSEGVFLGVFVLVTLIVYLPHWAVPAIYRLITRAYSDEPAKDVPYQHVVSLAVYKETIGVVAAGLHAINSQPQANRIHLVICLEEGAGTADEKLELKKQIAGQLTNLGWVRFYEHPKGLPNHIPSNGANIHNGMKCFLMDFGGLGDIDDWIYTKLDAQMILEYGNSLH